MKKLILFLVVLLFAVGLGIVIHNNPAHVFISIGHTSLQASLWFVLLTLIVGIFLVHQLIRLLSGLYHIPSSFQHFMADRREQASSIFTKKALRAFFEERWDTSETYFYKSAKKQVYPFFHYLAAAQAAFEQKKQEPANSYLKKAQKIAAPPDTLAVEIMRTRWQLKSNDYQQALTTLLLLRKISPTNPFVLISLKDIYLASHNWEALNELLPQLRRHTTLSPTLLDDLEQKVLGALLDQTGQLASLTALEENWQTIPKKWRQKPLLLAIYIKYLIKQNQHDKAENILKQALKKDRDAALLQQYAHVDSKNAVKQLARAELWLTQDKQNADLLFCLGKLCARHRLWGKAKTYLEMSLKYKPQAEIYPVLGQVLEQLDQKYAALDCYKTGLETFLTPQNSHCEIFSKQ